MKTKTTIAFMRSDFWLRSTSLQQTHQLPVAGPVQADQTATAPSRRRLQKNQYGFNMKRRKKCQKTYLVSHWLPTKRWTKHSRRQLACQILLVKLYGCVRSKNKY